MYVRICVRTYVRMHVCTHACLYVFVLPTWFDFFSVCNSVNIQLNCHPAVSSSRVFHPLFVSNCMYSGRRITLSFGYVTERGEGKMERAGGGGQDGKESV
jgi:hypothetical protein